MAEPNPVAIRTTNLTRSFGPVRAVDGLDLEVKEGELFGLVGPDGAGKTTVMRLLAAIMEPSGGEGWVAGLSITGEGEAIKEKIGYMSQRFGLYEDLTVMENLLFYADLYGVGRKERSQRIERLMEFSNLGPFTARLAGALSGGMKQKLGLACALIHTPRILLLDEPTNGVDPVSRRDFWHILYDLLKERVTILVSTAYLDEAERCTRVGLMYNGRLLQADDPMKIKESFSVPMVEIWTSESRRAAEVVAGLEGVRAVTAYGDRLHVAVVERGMAEGVVERLKGQGVVVGDHRMITPSLEDTFIAMVEGTK